MKRIIFYGVILSLILLINSCVTTPNNNGGSTNNFEQYIELVFGNSGFEEYTYYNKAYPESYIFDLNEVNVKLHISENESKLISKNDLTITISNSNGDIIEQINENLDEGVYYINFNYKKLKLSTTIEFVVIDNEIEDYWINFYKSNLDDEVIWNKESEAFNYDISKIKFTVIRNHNVEILDENEYTVKTYDSSGKQVNFNAKLEVGNYRILFIYNNDSRISYEISFKVAGLGDLSSYQGQTIEIDFWHAMGATSYDPFIDIVNEFKEEIYKLYGINVFVNFSSMGDYDSLYHSVVASIAAGVQPTVVQTYPDHVSSYLQASAVVDLNSYISHPDFGLEGDSDNNYGYIDAFWREGKLYGHENSMYSLPFVKSTEVLYYNKTIFDKYGWEAPKTWDDVITICEAWKQTSEYKNKKYNGYNVAGLGIDSSSNFFITLTKQWGSEYASFDEFGNSQILIDNDNTKDALNWFVKEFNNGNIATCDYFGADYCSNALLNGQIIMTIGSSAGVGYHVSPNGSFETGIAPYPQKAGAKEDEKYVIQQGTNVTLLKNQDKIKELLGWLFIKHLTNYESSLKFSTSTTYFTVRKDVINSAIYQECLNRDNIYSITEKVAISQYKYFYATPAFPNSKNLRFELEILIPNIIYCQEQYTVEKAIKEALENISK